MVASNTFGRQVVVPLTNKSGGSVAAGDFVYLSDGSNADSFTTGTTNGYTGGIGIAQETIANNGTGRVLVGGYAALVNVNASVTLGHFVKSYTVAKQATDAGTSRGSGTCGIFLTTSATPDAVIWQPDLGAGSGTTSNYPCQGRLTLTTATPVTTSDVTAATTVYFTPYLGNQIATYSGTAWALSTFTEKSAALTGLTASLPYDVFIVDGTLALELLAWTNATTRATALVLQDGIYVKSGATTRRYLGTVTMTGTTGQTEDSLLNRLVWNYYNRVDRKLKVTDTTDSWTSSATGFRSWNGSTANRVTVCVGVSENLVSLRFGALGKHSGGNGIGVGIGLDSTSANSADIFPGVNLTNIIGENRAEYIGYPGIGSHYLQLLEYDNGATTTFYGDVGFTFQQGGAVGVIPA